MAAAPEHPAPTTEPGGGLWRPGRRLAVIALAAWFAFNAGALIRGVAPLPDPYAHDLPWGMFKTSSSVYRTYRAVGTTTSGRRVDIPLTAHFAYSRGATDQRAYDVPRLLLRASRADRHAFANWLAARTATDEPLATVHLVVDMIDIDADGPRRHRTVSLGRFDVRAQR